MKISGMINISSSSDFHKVVVVCNGAIVYTQLHKAYIKYTVSQART